MNFIPSTCRRGRRTGDLFADSFFDEIWTWSKWDIPRGGVGSCAVDSARNCGIALQRWREYKEDQKENTITKYLMEV